MIQVLKLLKYPYLFHCFGDKSNYPEIDVIKNYRFLDQTHSKRVVTVYKKNNRLVKADGMVTSSNLFLAIKTADCLPIFFFDPQTKVAGAVHAGWRGLNIGIIKEAIKKMIIKKADPKSIICAIGPHIRKCCYQVSPEFKKKFAKHDLQFFKPTERQGLVLDLTALVKSKLLKEGLLHDNIEISSLCTCCNLDFYSFRREGAGCAKMISVIGLTG